MGDGSVSLSPDGTAPVRVMLLLSSLSGGGAERVAVNLLQRCDPGRVDIRLGVLSPIGPYLDEVDPARIVAAPGSQAWLAVDRHNSTHYHPHRLLPGIALGPGRVARMFQAARPQVVMSFSKGMNFLTWAAFQGQRGARPRWICREDNNTDAVIDDELANPLARATIKSLTRHIYPSADGLVTVTQGLASQLQDRLGLKPGQVRVIHNPLDIAKIERLAAEPLAQAPARPFVVTAGRLDHQKGQDLLIQAYASSRTRDRFDLVVLGRGDQEEALRRQAAALGVASQVRFHGYQANPWAWFARASLFVLPSRWEGFGNVVSEAMACGVPALVTDCDFGPREQVRHGRDGWVVPSNDPMALAQAMDLLLESPDLAARLAVAGRARAKAFDIDRIAAAYTQLFVEQSAAHDLDPASAAAGAPGPWLWRATSIVARDLMFRPPTA